MGIAFDKLGLTQDSGMLLLISCVAGSLVNLPLFQMRTIASQPPSTSDPLAWLRPRQTGVAERTVVAINMGGAILPTAFCAYLFVQQPVPLFGTIIAIAGQTAVCYQFSRPIPGIGIGMPVLLAPVTAAVLAVVFGGEHSAPVAYIAGTLGVLLGADLLRIRDIRTLGVPQASIGGAGTFDGVFITGIVAVLLA